jgi:general secretion pathway protein D
VVTLDNETAVINVTRAFPIFNVTASTANTTGGSTLTYSNLGTILEVTPRISANDYIWLKVYPIVSSLFGKETQVIGGTLNSADVFDVRSVISQVLIPNANTLVMGGLVKDNPNASYTKVPFLGDIPGLGRMFRSENKTMEKDNLIIFITPTIVKDADYQPSETDFLKSRPHYMKDPMNPSTSSDGAQPRGDWSNPLPPEERTDRMNQSQYPPKAAAAP